MIDGHAYLSLRLDPLIDLMPDDLFPGHLSEQQEEGDRAAGTGAHENLARRPTRAGRKRLQRRRKAKAPVSDRG